MDNKLTEVEQLIYDLIKRFKNKPLKTLGLLIFIGLIIFLYSLIYNLGSNVGTKTQTEPYVSTQTIYQNSGFTPLSYLDLDGRAWLVPLQYETLLKAREFGEAKGKENTLYLGRVVVTALDPSMRYVELESGISGGAFYKSLYTFYLPDGEDIKDETLREHILKIGDKSYKVTLLFIDTRNKEDLPKYAYTFRVEEVVK